MERDKITLLAQLLSGMREAVEKLEDARRDSDLNSFNSVKKEILRFQKRIDELI